MADQKANYGADTITVLEGLEALRPVEARVRVGHEGPLASRAVEGRVVDPVGAGDGVPRLGEDAGAGPVDRAAFLALKAQRVRPQLRAVDAA